MTRAFLCCFLFALGLATSATASAQAAFAAGDVNMRAGPDRDYPLVSWIPAGSAVTVMGCLSDYRWCDVVWGPNRGWVYAKHLNYPYLTGQVPIYSYGANIGLPIVTFSVVPYWNSYYRGRPWYGNSSYWASRPAYRPIPPSYRPPPHPPGWRPPPITRPPGYRPPPGGGSGGGSRPPPRPPGGGGGAGGRPPGGGGGGGGGHGGAAEGNRPPPPPMQPRPAPSGPPQGQPMTR